MSCGFKTSSFCRNVTFVISVWAKSRGSIEQELKLRWTQMDARSPSRRVSPRVSRQSSPSCSRLVHFFGLRQAKFPFFEFLPRVHSTDLARIDCIQYFRMSSSFIIGTFSQLSAPRHDTNNEDDHNDSRLCCC
jgi:hypothetical protein